MDSYKMLICLLIAVIVDSSLIQIGLVTSQYTLPSVREELNKNLNGILNEVKQTLNSKDQIQVIWEEIDLIISTDESKWRIPEKIEFSKAQVILDAANLVRYSNYLAGISVEKNLLHIVLSRAINTLEDETSYSSTLYAETTYVTQALAMLDLVQFYGWRNVGLINNKNSNNQQMAKTIKNNVRDPVQVKDQVIFDDEQFISTNEVISRLKSTTKDSGARVIVVMTKATLAAQILRAADKSIMGGVGYAWLLSSDSLEDFGNILKNAVIGMNDEDLGVVKSGAIGLRPVDFYGQKDNLLLSYVQVLTLILQAYSKLINPQAQDIRNYFISNPKTPNLPYPLNFDKNGIKQVKYEIINIRNFAEFKVGEWDPVTKKIFLYPSTKIIWPGFSFISPNDTVPIIQLGLLYPGHDNEGNTLNLGTEILNGFDLAVETINKDPNLLSGYMIEGIHIDTFLLPSLAKTKLKSLSTFNIIGFVGPHSLELCESYANNEAISDDAKPMITYLGSSTLLTDSNNYPYLLQMVQPDGLQAVALTLFIQLQGWKKIAVLYTDDEFGLGVFTSFQANIGTLDVTVENDEKYQVIRYQVDEFGKISQKTKDSVDEALTEIVRQQLKVILYLGNPKLGLEIAKTGFKKELHGDEYAWIGTSWLSDSILSDLDTTYKSSKSDILKVLRGSIGLSSRYAQNDIGKAFSSEYSEKFYENYTAASMLTYDSVLTFANVINGIVSRGDDFNIGKDLTNSIRSSDLTGASGKIKFSEGNNGRSAYGYNIVNYQDGEALDVLEYDPSNPNLFTVINNRSIFWGDRASSAPDSSWPSSYDCPFAKHMSKSSPRGLAIIISIGSFLFLLTLILSFFSYKKWKQIEIVPITSTVVRSWKDTLVQAQIAIEFFQFVAIAPNFSSLEIVITAASNIFMLDIMKVASSNKSDYWILLSVVCTLCYIWFILVIVIMLNGEHWLKKVPLCKRVLSLLNTLFLPFYGNTFFLPALAILLDMFVCDHRAQGKDYVWRDCYTNCWEGKHKTYLVMSSIAIICYEPIAAYSRPLWQQSRTGLNLKIQPFFLLLKTCVQILLIAIGKSLQSTSQVAHGIVYTVIISVFTGLIYKLQPFNYNRCNLWEFSSMLAVSYLSFLATLSHAKDPKNIGWFIALIFGWGVIFLVSVLVQNRKMPNLLLPPGGNRVQRKIYDIISLKSNNPADLDESNLSKMQDYKAVDESSAQINPQIDVSKDQDEQQEYIEVHPMIKEDNN
jgi:ABC-type branched-subunit amino acid transport system substrate-binding protein